MFRSFLPSVANQCLCTLLRDRVCLVFVFFIKKKGLKSSHLGFNVLKFPRVEISTGRDRDRDGDRDRELRSYREIEIIIKMELDIKMRF